jgi:hypothetical protein
MQTRRNFVDVIEGASVVFVYKAEGFTPVSLAGYSKTLYHVTHSIFSLKMETASFSETSIKFYTIFTLKMVSNFPSKILVNFNRIASLLILTRRLQSLQEMTQDDL